MSLDLKERINCFQFILYKDSETLNFNNIIEIVKSSAFYSCKYYYCLHNKDSNENGELKKPHYHLVVKLENAVAIQSILNCLSNDDNIKQALQNNLSIVKSVKGSIRYLIHHDDKDKYQYDMSDIITNDRNYMYYFNDNTIVENFSLVLSIIKENKNINCMYDLMMYCVDKKNIIAMQYIQDNAYLISCLFRK